MARKKPKLQFRYYEMGANTQVLALLGENWRRPYGEDILDMHFHNYMEIGICHEGNGRSILRDSVNAFEGGCITIVPPNYPHNNISEPGTLAYWEWMYFDIESALQDMKEISYNKLNTEYMQNMLYDSAFFFHQEEYPKISRIIMEIRGECERKAYMYQEKVRSLLQGFVVELLRIHNVTSDMQRKDPRNFQIAPAINYVKKHYNENIRIQDLAGVCNISESHFRRIFQECMNITPNDYVNMVRVQEASRLLLKTHATMEEIAYRVGYGNVSTFNRNFKRIIGMTPYHWKRSPDNYAGQMLEFQISALKGW